MVTKRAVLLAKIRNKIVYTCQWAVDNADQIDYIDPSPRPMKTLNLWKTKTLPISGADCSETATGIYFSAGAPDPNHNNYNGIGNTRIMFSTNPFITKSEVRHGDIGLFVDANGLATHAIIAMVRYGDSVFTHGSASGPHIYTLSQEQSYHLSESLVWIRVS